MKILLAADGSEYTTKAVTYVTEHFDWFKSSPELHLLHVKGPLSDGLTRALVGSAAVQAYYKDEATAALAPAERLLQEKGITYRSSYAIGEVAEKIDDYVKDNNIDMIVMGSHGHTALKNLVMGSVATRVLAGTSVPVLLVR